jgi:hypothetical protein
MQVYFVPNQRQLRKPKKYEVPHCPLLQVNQLCMGNLRSTPATRLPQQSLPTC